MDDVVQRCSVRCYQNYDGMTTDAGKKRRSSYEDKVRSEMGQYNK